MDVHLQVPELAVAVSPLTYISARQKGNEVIIDGDVTQNLLVYGKFTEDEKKDMHDTPYVNKGQNIEDYLPPGKIKIDEEKTQVT
jgi:hypothetical protein